MLNFSVDASLCTRCGLCAADCPSRIITQAGDAIPSIAAGLEERCIRCQHCLAICPAAAISILGRQPAQSLPLDADSFPDFDRMSLFLRGRRSVRQYRDADVEPGLIDDLLRVLANGPTGVNAQRLTFTVIDGRAVMQRLRGEVLARLQAANEAGQIPERLQYLRQAPTAFAEHGQDILFRDAPHALIVSAPSDIPCPAEDVILTLAYFDLLAHSARLGTVWWGMLKLLLSALPDLKPRFGLEPRQRHFYGMLFGIPAVHYPRCVQREDGALVQRIR